MSTISVSTLLGRDLNGHEAKNAPDRIYTEGSMDIPLDQPKVAVVGTRKPTYEGIEEAQSLTKALVGGNVTVVSGLAAGIDTVAHTTAMREGGRTVAVIGTPLDREYPASNRSLQREIARKHLVVSQFPAGQTVMKGNFVKRNRTMALISDATVIVEANEGSGTVHQGWEAIRLGRKLFVCGPVVQKNPRWLHEMQRHGARVCRDYDEILNELPQIPVRMIA
ncbi:MAG: DNA-processing protein DprA [Thaumarchaeota archaeon]|nr:DNA-processing protein DprA [Nitrososphaerota archaeon]